MANTPRQRRQAATERTPRNNPVQERTTRASARQPASGVDKRVARAAQSRSQASGDQGKASAATKERRTDRTQRTSSMKKNPSRDRTQRRSAVSDEMPAKTRGRKNTSSSSMVIKIILGCIILAVVVVGAIALPESGPSEADKKASAALNNIPTILDDADSFFRKDSFDDGMSELEQAQSIINNEVLAVAGLQVRLVNKAKDYDKKISRMRSEALVVRWDKPVSQRATPLRYRLNYIIAEPDLAGLAADVRLFLQDPLPDDAPAEPALSELQERYAQMFNDVDQIIGDEKQRRQQGLVRPDFTSSDAAANEIMRRRERYLMPKVEKDITEDMDKRRWDNAFKALRGYHHNDPQVPFGKQWDVVVASARAAWADDRVTWLEQMATDAHDAAALKALSRQIRDQIQGYGVEDIRDEARQLLAQVRQAQVAASNN